VPLVQYIFQRHLIHANGKDLNHHNNVHCDSFLFLLALQRMVDHCCITNQTAGNKPYYDTWRCLPYLQCLFPLIRFQYNILSDELRDGGCVSGPRHLVQQELPREHELV
jgi:hypothetical protein